MRLCCRVMQASIHPPAQLYDWFRATLLGPLPLIGLSSDAPSLGPSHSQDNGVFL